MLKCMGEGLGNGEQGGVTRRVFVVDGEGVEVEVVELFETELDQGGFCMSGFCCAWCSHGLHQAEHIHQHQHVLQAGLPGQAQGE